MIYIVEDIRYQMPFKSFKERDMCRQQISLDWLYYTNPDLRTIMSKIQITLCVLYINNVIKINSKYGHGTPNK